MYLLHGKIASVLSLTQFGPSLQKLLCMQRTLRHPWIKKEGREEKPRNKKGISQGEPPEKEQKVA